MPSPATRKKKNEDLIRGDVIRKAFDTLNVLGIAVKEIIIEDLAKHGITLDSHHHYSLTEIENRLKEIVGPDGAPLLVARLKRALLLIGIVIPALGSYSSSGIPYHLVPF